MALHVRAEILQRYSDFYAFAQDGVLLQDCESIVLHAPNDDALLMAVQDSPNANVVVLTGGELTTLAPVALLPQLQWLRVEKCPLLKELWNMEFTLHLHALALVHCKNLRNLTSLAHAYELQHLYLQCGVWDNVVLESLAPLKPLQNLRTLDLSCKGVKDSQKLNFNALYPDLEALTITPSLRKMFLTASEGSP